MRLRIISGIYKGRLIKVPDSKLIRPTTDRVRETLFNILNNLIDFEDIKVLDIYAGSGSLGFECLSRGAKEIDFVEKNSVIYNNLEENIKSLGVYNDAKVFKMEAIKFASMNNKLKYDLIVLDPPFFKDDVYDVIQLLLKNEFLTEDGFIVIERSIQTREKDFENFKVSPFRIIGDTCLYKILPLSKTVNNENLS